MSLAQLQDIVKQLRGPGGCPWDKEQTFQSLKPHVIEEAYELVEALDTSNMPLLKEECGDVLLHVVMIAEMASEIGAFDLADIASHVSEKMIRRHPHVFGDKTVDSVSDVWKHWESIKQTEKTQGVIDSVPPHLPALKRAEKIQKKVARVGFDWETSQGPFEKLIEEIQEFKETLQTPDTEDPAQTLIQQHRQLEEFGDLLFSVVNVGRFHGLDCEAALQQANAKFASRFKWMEATIGHENVQKKPSLQEWDKHWDQAKLALETMDTVSAGGVVIHQKTKKIAVVSQHKVAWSLPKGHVDPGESLMEAAVREIEEETGLTQLSLIKPLGSYSRYKIGKDGQDDKSERKHMVFYLFETNEDVLAPQDPDNPMAEWKEPADIPGLLTHPKDSLFFQNALDAINEYR